MMQASKLFKRFYVKFFCLNNFVLNECLHDWTTQLGVCRHFSMICNKFKLRRKLNINLTFYTFAYFLLYFRKVFVFVYISTFSPCVYCEKYLSFTLMRYISQRNKNWWLRSINRKQKFSARIFTAIKRKWRNISKNILNVHLANY